MSTIDQRVVEMRFDNKQFESGVATTMSTLEKFKQSLNLTGATRGLENVSSAAKKCDMSALGSAVETVRSKFSALEVMGITALANITNSAVNAGKRMVSALTIDPIKTGFAEYETQINAVQTILANTSSKGTTLDDVNSALDTLNTYADKTIYNFTEMTRNIGTFTAAGVDLDTSVKSIQGIANLAAVSGSTSQQASTAMYQLSQALAAGKVQLMDWNSVVNAGMGGQVFQDALKRTAKVMGKDVDGMIKKYGSFRESLTKGEWLTSDVLTKTLEQFTMAAEEGTEQWEAYKKSLMEEGYTEAQATEILKMANTATNAATKVKTFTQLWDTLKEAAQSGWTQTWEIIVGDFEEAKELLTKVSDVIGKVINDSAKARNDLLQGWKDAGGRTDLIDGIANIFQGLVNILTPIKEAFREIFPPMTVKNLTDFTDGFKVLTERFKEFTATHGDQIKATFKGIFSVLDIGWSVIKALVGGVSSLIGYIFGFSGSLLDVTASIGGWLTNLRETVNEVDIFGKVIEKVTEFVAKIVDGFKRFGTSSRDAFSSESVSGFLGVMQTIWDIVVHIGSAVGKVFSVLGQGISNAFSNLDFNQILSAINGGLIASILVTIKTFTKGLFEAFDGEEGVLTNIKGIFTDVRGCLQSYQEQLKAGTLLKIAGAIGILAASIFVISTIDPDALNASLGAITVLFAELLGALAIFTKIGDNMKGVMKGTTVMIGMSVAIAILATALKKISTIDPAGIAKGLVGVGVLMAELSLFMRTAKFDGKMMGTATGIVILSSAMLILASAVKKFGAMEWEEIGKGLTAIGGLLAELALFANLTGNASHVVSTGVAMVLLGTAMKIFASAVMDFAAMQWGEIGRGLVAMAGALAAVTLAMNFMPKNMVSMGVGLIAVSGAMMILANAMTSFGGMGWDEIARGLVAMGGALGILAIALNLMNGTLAGSAALIIAAGALAIIAPVMQQLGQMTWAEIGMGLVTIAAAFGALGLAGALLTPVIPSILGLAGSLALIGVAALGVGVGLGLIATGLTALAVAGTTGATAIVAALTIIVTGIVNLIPAVCIQLANGVIAFAQTIASGVPVLLEAVSVLLDAAIVLLETYVPRLVETGITLLLSLLRAIASRIGDVIDTAVDVVINFIAGIASAIPRIIQSGIDLMINFINGMANGIRSNTTRVIAATNNLMDAVIGAVKAYFTNFTSRGKDLARKLIDGVKSKMSDFKSAAKNMMEGFINGVKEKFTSVKNAAVNAIKGAVEGVKSFLGIHSPSREFAEIGEYSMMGFAKGITDDMTAEQAAVKKAQNIRSAFQTEMDKLTLDKTTLDLEYKLKSTSGETVDEAEKLNKELDIQSQRVQLANGEYEITMREFGETAEETQKAYNKLLEEKIAMSELSAKLSTIQQQEFAANKEATESYIDWMKSSSQLLALGFSSSQIDAAARRSTGYSGTSWHIEPGKNKNGGKWTEEELAGVTAEELGPVIEEHGETIVVSAEELGINVAEGFAKGISEGSSDVAKASESIADAALTASKSKLGINSPSKAFYQIGRWSIEGMVSGLTKYAGAVKNTVGEIGGETLDAMSEAISGISSIFGTDFDTNPVISPVLDLTNIQNGANQLNGLFAQRSVALAGVNANLSDANLRALSQLRFGDSGNSEVVSAISELRSDFGSLIKAINNMHIRMDSGTVVGELIGKIDSGLGQIATHKGRGN